VTVSEREPICVCSLLVLKISIIGWYGKY
jgi:hypothetical protein